MLTDEKLGELKRKIRRAHSVKLTLWIVLAMFGAVASSFFPSAAIAIVIPVFVLPACLEIWTVRKILGGVTDEQLLTYVNSHLASAAQISRIEPGKGQYRVGIHSPTGQKLWLRIPQFSGKVISGDGFNLRFRELAEASNLILQGYPRNPCRPV